MEAYRITTHMSYMSATSTMALTLVKGVRGQIDESLWLQHVQEKREIVTAISL